MCKTSRAAVALLVSLLAAAAFARAETLEEIVAEVEKASASIKDMSGTMTMDMNIMGQSILAEGEMKMQLPNRFAVSMEVRTPSMNTSMRMKMVSDGRVVYQEINPGGKTMVNRLDAGAAGLNMGLPGVGGAGMGGFTPNAAQALAELRKVMDVALMEDATLDDGQKAWVIEGKFKPEFYGAMGGKGAPNAEVLKSQMAGMRLYVGQRDKFMNKMEFLSSTGERTGSMTFSNLKFNSGLGDADFTYVPPEGVAVNDMTGAMRLKMDAAVKAEETAAEGRKTAAADALPSTMLKPGVSAPAFSVTALDGKKLNLVDLRGKPVLLCFWASWHKGSLERLAEANAIAEVYRPRGLEVLALSLDEPAAAGELRALLREKGIALKAAIGSDEIFDGYWISEIPCYVLIDAEGKVLSSEAKPKDFSQLKQTLAHVFMKTGAVAEAEN